MSWTAAKKSGLAYENHPLDVKFYVLKDNGSDWLDLTDRVTHDRLVDFGTISHGSEKRVGVFYAQNRNLLLDNSDGYFAGTPPTGITTWLKHKCKFTLQGETIGVFLIDNGPTIDTTSANATFTLVGLQKRLMDKDADTVKDGQDWFQNRSVGFLVSEIFNREYAADGTWEAGSPPTHITMPLADTAQIRPSHYGRPPEWNGTEWLKHTKICRAICWGDGVLLLGCDDELWKWDPATELYTKLCAAGDLPGWTAGQHIRQIWWDPTLRTTGRIVFSVWADEVAGECTTQAEVLTCTAAGATLTSERSDPDMFTGTRTIRRGRYETGPPDWGATYIGCFRHFISTHAAGEDICIPFPQQVCGGVEVLTPPVVPNLYNKELPTIFGFGSSTWTPPENAMPQISQAAYRIAYANQDVNSLNVRFNIGQRYLFAYDPVNHYLAYTVSLNPLSACYVYIRDLSASSTLRSITVYTKVPLAMCFATYGGSTYLYASWMDWKRTDTGWPGTDGDPSINTLKRYYIGSGTDVTMWDSSDLAADMFKTIVRLYGSPDGNLHGCWLQRDQIYTAKYQTFVIEGSAAPTPIWGTGLASTMPLGGFVEDADYVYFIDMATGQLYRQNDSISSPTATVQGGGIPAVDNEPCLLAGLAKKAGTPPTFYGVSTPSVLPELQAAIPAGKYYLFQFANTLTDRVELADFTELSMWDALALLAERMDHTMGFNEAGEFYFKARPTGTPSETFQVTPAVAAGEYQVDSITRDPGADEIFNVVETLPYGVVVAEPEGKVELIEASKFKGQVFLQQKDNATRSIYLYCTAAGTAAEADAVSRLRFRWFVEDVLFETSLRLAAISTNSYVDVYNITDVAPGDYLSVQDGVDKEVLSIDAANRRITLTTTLGTNFNKGAVVKIRKPKHRKSSDDITGITLLSAAAGTGTTLYVDSTAELPRGTILRLESTAGIEECRVTQVVSATELTVTRALSGTTAVNHADNTPVRAYWCPPNLTEYWAVGSTNVEIKVTYNSDDGSFEKNEDYKRFLVGDRIRITCAGLTLAEIQGAKQIAIDTASVDKYGRLQFPDSGNRFLDYTFAEAWVLRMLSLYHDPHYKFGINGDLLPWITGCALVYVKNKGLLPNSSSYQEAAYARKADLDISRKGEKWELRAVNGY